MNREPNTNVQSGGVANAGQNVRPTVFVFVGLMCLACAGLVVGHFILRGGDKAAKADSAATPPTEQAASAKPKPAAQTKNKPVTRTGTGGYVQSKTAAITAPEARQMVNRLVQFKSSGTAMTDEESAVWKTNFKDLVKQGDYAIPAIREFLATKKDMDFSKDGFKALGYASARQAMLDALMQIGSSGAVTALSEALSNPMNPQEIARLAQSLEKLAPGTFSQDAMNAARQMLSSALSGNFSGVDIAPLFQVLQNFGGAEAVADLTGSVERWNYYATSALAGLPDGAGIPTLVQMASGEIATAASVRLPVLVALMEKAGQFSDARNVLLQLARANKISAYEWNALVPALAGYQTVLQNSGFENLLAGVSPNDIRKTTVSSGNQSLLTAPLAVLTIAQTRERLAFVAQMLSATTDPAGLRALQQAKAQLDARLVQLAGAGAH